MGFWLAGFLAMFLATLIELPISVFHLPNYLLNIFQVLIVVISLLITYKILNGGTPEMLRFMNSARVSYEKFNGKTNETEDIDEIEAGGSMFGEFTGVFVKAYKPKQS